MKLQRFPFPAGTLHDTGIQMSDTIPISPAVPAKWSKIAVAGVVFSIVGFLTLGLGVGLFLAAIGTVCGHVGQSNARLKRLRGKRLGTFAIGLGYFSMLLFPVLVIVVAVSFPAIGWWRVDQSEHKEKESREKAWELYVACESYSKENFGRYPTDWSQLEGAVLSSDKLQKLLRSTYTGGSMESFEIVPHGRPVPDAAKDSVIVIQEIVPANVKTYAVVFASGETKSLQNPGYEPE